jgi:peptidoglycan/LPS O-acetylase OafA/YrhL
MNLPIKSRAKLIGAVVSLLVVFGFSLFNDDRPGDPIGWVVFRLVCFLLGAWIAVFGIFRIPMLHLLWGAGLILAAAALLFGFFVGGFKGELTMVWAVISLGAAVYGAYLLLRDPTIENYRRELKTRHSP